MYDGLLGMIYRKHDSNIFNLKYLIFMKIFTVSGLLYSTPEIQDFI